MALLNLMPHTHIMPLVLAPLLPQLDLLVVILLSPEARLTAAGAK